MPAPKPFSEPELGISSLWERAVSLDLVFSIVGQFLIHNIWYTANIRMSCICNVHIISYVHYTIEEYLACSEGTNKITEPAVAQLIVTIAAKTFVKHRKNLPVSSSFLWQILWNGDPLRVSIIFWSISAIESGGIHTNLRAAKVQKEQPCLLWVQLGLVSYFWAPKLYSGFDNLTIYST